MTEKKLTVRVPGSFLEGAKHYAKEQDTTLTRLISEYLRQLTTQSDTFVDAPIVRRLSGSLSPDVSEKDYTRYLEEKYVENA